MDTIDLEKENAARKSLEFVEEGMVVGLGSGSTAHCMIRLLGERVQKGLRIRGLPTSDASADLARAVGIPLTSFDEVDSTDVTIDGADEIGPDLQLIKGGGGALLREKIVASSSKRMVVIGDARKQVECLGKFPLPVEVIQFASEPVKRRLQTMGGNPVLRRMEDGKAFITDEGNFIYDCHFGRIPEPVSTAAAIKSITGVVEHGLFIHLASIAVIGVASGARLISR